MNFFFFRRSLFFKIFFSFWGTSLAVGIVFLLASSFVRSDLLPERWREATVKIQATAAADIFEKNGKTALTDYLSKTNQETGIEGRLLDQNGRDVTGTELQPELRSVLEDSTSSESFNTDISIRKVVSSYRFISGEGNEYIFISETTRFSPYSFLYVDLRVRLVRFPLIILTAGLICYLLARYLTSPIVRLQKTVKELADGNLSVRVGPAFANRKDEIADLSQDFDEMAEKLDASARAQKRLFADISHELRSPLARLGIAASLAREGNVDDLNEAIDVIEREAERMNDLIGQLLTLARLEHDDKNRREFEHIDLVDLINKIASDADFEGQTFGKHVVVTSLPSRCTVVGNSGLLRSALENVIRNAVRHTKDESTVEVSLNVELSEQNELARITILDQGDGIPQEKLGQIFHPFYRAAEGRERETGGVGLGLAIAERAVILHHGKIRAVNASDGGLRVTIEIPIHYAGDLLLT